MVFTLKLVGLHVASDLFNVGSAALHVARLFLFVMLARTLVTFGLAGVHVD